MNIKNTAENDNLRYVPGTIYLPTNINYLGEKKINFIL